MIDDVELKELLLDCAIFLDATKHVELRKSPTSFCIIFKSFHSLDDLKVNYILSIVIDEKNVLLV